MRRTETIRIVAIAVVFVAAFYFLLPTIRMFTMSPKELADFRASDRDGYNSLVRKSIKLGLDLQGGLRLVLEPEVTQGQSAQVADLADQALVVISNRINGMGLTEPDIRKSRQNQIVIEIPGIDSVSVADAKRQISQIAKLEFRFLETPTATQQTVEKIDGFLAKEFGQSKSDTSAATTQDSAQKASDSAVASTDTGAMAARTGKSRLPFEVTSLTDFLIPADNSSYYVRSDIDKVEQILALPEVRALLPPKSEFMFSTGPENYNGVFYQRLYLVRTDVEMTGDALEGISPSFSELRQPEVLFAIRSKWRARFGSITGNNLQKPLAIVLDNRVESAPIIQSQITTNGRITMRSGATFQEAQELANVLKSGALPTRLLVKEDVIVGPSLGRDAIHKGVLAALIGLIAVVLIMVVYYRMSGVISVIALLFNLFVLMAILTVLNATLTVPGIAGIVLLVGIAVDASVLIFERVREELVTGKTVRAAIDAGYTRAAVAIIDSNITTMLVAGLLYFLGSGPVRGFAVTLSLGILISLFSALVVTRTMFEFRKTYKSLSI